MWTCLSAAPLPSPCLAVHAYSAHNRCLAPPPNACSCAINYGSIGPVDPAAASPFSIKAGVCQLSTDASDGMFSIFASRGTNVPFTSGVVRRPAPVPPPDPAKASNTTDKGEPHVTNST